jgi:hypothetical protein
VLPSEALWKRAAFEMQSPLVQALGVTPFTSTSVPSLLFIIYAGLYLAVMVALTIRKFKTRDL